jgi:hypothetical protein
MKTYIFTAFLLPLTFLSFISPAPDVRSIRVTAGIEASFDLYLNGKVTRDLRTPYIFEISDQNAKLIFKSHDETALTIEVLNDRKSALKSQWKTTVVTIENNSMTTFGMD